MQITYNGVVTLDLRFIVLVPQWAMDIGPNKEQLLFETSDTSTPVAKATELIRGLLAFVLTCPISSVMTLVIFLMKCFTMEVQVVVPSSKAL
jgi:hypothetical protein